MINLDTLEFDRCSDWNPAYVDHFLDDPWLTKIEKLAAINNELSPYFSDDEWSTVSIYVAGKADRPDARSLAAAQRLLDRLPEHLEQIGCRYCSEHEWSFNAIISPYQLIEICYFLFKSPYSAGMDYALKFEDCKFGHAGFITPFDESPLISETPQLINRAINLIDDDNARVLQLQARIENEKLMGLEIVDDVTDMALPYIDTNSNLQQIVAQLQDISREVNNAG